MTILTRAAYAEPGTALNFKTGTWRVQKPVHQHTPAPCHIACPAGEDAQAYIAQVQAGNLQAAWETLVSVNPLPAITGRVCPHFCESACNRKDLDEAIAIHAIERFLGDEAMNQNWAYPVSEPAADAPEIAIVGAGPAGLSAAYHLLRAGYRSVIFDENPEAGGTLRSALPPYRLPRSVLELEIQRLLDLPGIRFEPLTKLGRDISLDELKNNYPAVFIGVGAQKAQEWSIDGATPSDLHSGLDLIREWVSIGTLPTPKSVAVVGAGNTAVDLSRIMKRAGVEEVHLISHKPIPGPGIPASEAMPAIPREVHEALEEGVHIHEYRGIRRLILRGEKVTGVELVHMKKLKQPNGRLRRVAFSGTETILNVEQVIPAIGQVMEHNGLESILEAGLSHFDTDEWGHILNQSNAYKTCFSGGDARYGSGTVTEAVGDARRAAIAIAAMLEDKNLPATPKAEPLSFSQLNLNYYAQASRIAEPALPVAEREEESEITRSLDLVSINKEAKRCFSCGNCLACDNCWTLCPDSAVLKTRDVAFDGSQYVFDYDYCKGCGLCAEECPCGYISMQEDL
ncbi:FAD-dependent oxidoreductase [Candidatus Venteria ishoeyi]|uniref:Glutamate synthase [NADPH] small chain n=1 Tax=Candidatus Venteria ishoeyi TaxID=1899563 RepID=A0A1H6F608_9GAMM|nr:FAD-dependent oxidoreductase [Candidatus Venteria ishoeyi]SEH04414.1 Glutamate synthase [NADPH] small chain [Candidatus Venteria ishoeyi]